MTEKKIPVIMDVDTGVDDAMALMLAAANEGLDILALTAVFGNRPADETAHNTLKVARFLGLNAPVAKGASRPLLDPALDYSTEPVVDVHGRDGLGEVGHTIPEPADSLSPLTAFELMAEKISGCEEKVTIIATGPLTNIATFLLGYPQLHKKIDKILLMGGAAAGGNLKPTAEANIGHDPEAAQVIFTSGLPVYMFGLDATMGCWITDEERDEMAKTGKVGTFMKECLAKYSALYNRLAGLPGAVLHDSLPVAWLLDNEVATLKKYYVSMDLNGGRTRGCTVTDTADLLKREPNVYVALKADREKFIEMHLEAAKHFS